MQRDDSGLWFKIQSDDKEGQNYHFDVTSASITDQRQLCFNLLPMSLHIHVHAVIMDDVYERQMYRPTVSGGQ